MKCWKRRNLSERTGPSTSNLSRIERSATWIDLDRRRKISRLNSTIRPNPRGQLRSSYARSCMQANLQPSRPVKLPMFSGAGARRLRSNSAACESFRRRWRQPLSGARKRRRPQGCAHGGRARGRRERNRPRVRQSRHLLRMESLNASKFPMKSRRGDGPTKHVSTANWQINNLAIQTHIAKQYERATSFN